MGAAPTEPDPRRFPTRMGAADAVMWDIEEDPVLRSTITAVALLDRSPDRDLLEDRLERASRLIPRLRQRVVSAPFRVGRPRWVVDPHFDLGYHLRRVRAPEEGGVATALGVAEPMAMDAFDRARPLWQFTLVEGLSEGRAALVQKLHHSLTDGVGGIELALLLLDDRPDPPDRGPLPAAPEPDSGDAASLLLRAAADGVGEVARGAVGLPVAAARVAGGVLRDPAGSLEGGLATLRSAGRLLAPIPETASPIMRDRSLSRRFDTLEVGLGDLRAAGHVADGTVNDAFLAAVVGGLARYHHGHGVELPELRLTMPINLRQPGDPLGGNRFAPARFAVPATVDDPVERMRILGGIAHGWQHEPALAMTDTLAGVLDRLPVPVTTAVFGSMLRHVDAVVTNVAGVPQRSWLAGAEVLREYAFAPPTGAALNVSLVSHLDLACIGIVVDTAAVGDPDALVEALRGGFDEVLAVAGHRTVHPS